MKQNKLKIISAKDLGRLNMPDFCPRCFWIERHIDKPSSVFPGIFSTLDAVTKRSTHRSFAQKNKIPGWLPITDAVEVEEGDTYFKLPVEQGKWVLTGKPDESLDSDEEFKLGFKTYSISIDLDLDIVEELLIKAREILNQSAAPSSAANCKGICQWVDRIVKWGDDGKIIKNLGEVPELF